jgi:DNA mismatch repair protein MSH4
VGNDVLIGPFNSLQLVVGPNGSGKSVYLRQLALIIILAQSGCFIPAQWASIKIYDRILSRINSEDDMEGNASTFSLEMMETNHILESMNARSLIIIDELCRGTSSEDGIAICWSVCEHIIKSKSHTLFATHFNQQLNSLATLYPTVRILSMRVTANVPVSTTTAHNANNKLLRYWFRAEERKGGEVDLNLIEGYGIKVAESVHLPSAVIQQALAIRSHLKSILQIKNVTVHAEKSVSSSYSLLKRLTLLRGSTLDERGIRKHLQSMKERFSTKK